MISIYTAVAVLLCLSWLLSMALAFSLGREAERRAFRFWVAGIGTCLKSFLDREGKTDGSGNAD